MYVGFCWQSFVSFNLFLLTLAVINLSRLLWNSMRIIIEFEKDWNWSLLLQVPVVLGPWFYQNMMIETKVVFFEWIINIRVHVLYTCFNNLCLSLSVDYNHTANPCSTVICVISRCDMVCHRGGACGKVRLATRTKLRALSSPANSDVTCGLSSRPQHQANVHVF